MEMKTKINTRDLLKLKSFCTAKEIKQKDNPQARGKYMQRMRLTKD